MSELAVNSSELSLLPRKKAAAEISETERTLSIARSLSEWQSDTPVSAQQRIARHAVQQAFFELVEIQGIDQADIGAALELFVDTPELANVSLRRIVMNGEWQRTRSFEEQLFGTLHSLGFDSINWFARDAHEAKRTFSIPAGFTNQRGYVALHGKRLWGTAHYLEQREGKRQSIDLDKIFSFALNFEQLSSVSPEASAETRLIIATTMFKTCNLGVLFGRTLEAASPDEEIDMAKMLLGDDVRGTVVTDLYNDPEFSNALEDVYRLSQAMKRHKIPLDALLERLVLPDPTQLQHSESIAAMEWAINEQDDIVTPATTSYYGH